MADSILQCGYHQFFRHTPVHGYAGSLIPAQVHDASRAEPAFIRWDVCNAAHHFQSGPISFKIPVRNIFCCWEFHNRRIDEQTVLKMHGLFCQNIEPEHAGRYRDVRGRITGSQYPVATPEKIKKEMDGLFAWVQKERDDCHPVEFAARLHKRFVFIHPFRDDDVIIRTKLEKPSKIKGWH